MKRIRLSLLIGFVLLPCWLLFYVFVFQDFYLSWPVAGMVLKVVLAPAPVANLVGILFALGSLPAVGARRAFAGIVLNGIPLLIGAWFLWWLFFGLRI